MAWIKCDKSIWLVNHELGMVISPPCGLKSCKRCAKRRRKLIVMRILSQMTMLEKTHVFYFYTITPNNKDIWAKDTRQTFQKGWERLRKRLNRRFNGELYWVLAKEMTKGSGEYTNAPPFVHGHVIIGVEQHTNFIFVGTDELSEMCKEVGLGWVCLVGHEDSKDLPMKGMREARYVAKYSTKMNLDDYGNVIPEENIPRAIAWSRNWEQLPEPELSEQNYWELLNITDESVHGFVEVTGYKNMVQWLEDEDE